MDRFTWQARTKGTSAAIFILAASMSTAALAAETVEYRTSVSDLIPIKLAVAKILPSIRVELLTIYIASARQTADQTVYVCGLVGGIGDDAAHLFFAERKREGYVARALDMDINAPGDAKSSCDEYGFNTPKPGYLEHRNADPKRDPIPSLPSKLNKPLDPDNL